uniref:Transcription factor Spi-C n=1 Tax=Ciona intestinalis TaxID=7719 RepID=H2XXQ5_CIOIN|nr:transcription factor protein isoform X1 [Ciona intestinalis]|eukprot:XP_026690564.1 transcription factor protein isoform X1 [Ciona intestinalis]
MMVAENLASYSEFADISKLQPTFHSDNGLYSMDDSAEFASLQPVDQGYDIYNQQYNNQSMNYVAEIDHNMLNPQDVLTTHTDPLLPSNGSFTTSYPVTTTYAAVNQQQDSTWCGYGTETCSSYFSDSDISLLEVSDDECPSPSSYCESPLNVVSQQISDVDSTNQSPGNELCMVQNAANGQTQQKTPTVRRNGRRKRRQPILSEFLYNALECPDKYGDKIRWVDRPRGIFEFISETKEILAEEWGLRKRNQKVMTYQKMSRALRLYINKDQVMNKISQKLRYAFRPDFMHSMLRSSANQIC